MTITPLAQISCDDFRHPQFITDPRNPNYTIDVLTGKLYYHLSTPRIAQIACEEGTFCALPHLVHTVAFMALRIFRLTCCIHFLPCCDMIDEEIPFYVEVEPLTCKQRACNAGADCLMLPLSPINCVALQCLSCYTCACNPTYGRKLYLTCEKMQYEAIAYSRLNDDTRATFCPKPPTRTDEYTFPIRESGQGSPTFQAMR